LAPGRFFFISHPMMFIFFLLLSVASNLGRDSPPPRGFRLGRGPRGSRPRGAATAATREKKEKWDFFVWEKKEGN
jgi:hypothetical protein